MPTEFQQQRAKLEQDHAGTLRDACIGMLFMDSGAHSLYNIEVMAKKGRVSRQGKWDFFKGDVFWNYVDKYARFLKRNKDVIDYYVNVDVIYNPELSWKVLKYLENEHGLNPVPVIHCNTPLPWVKKHLDAGYEFLGIGGLGQGTTRQAFVKWADGVFALLCPASNKRLPLVRTHGFAMTSWRLMRRYPWWSVDSTSWLKTAAYGHLIVPHKRKGKFTFDEEPYRLYMDTRKPKGKFTLQQLSQEEDKILREWLAVIEVPYGKMSKQGEELEWGVSSGFRARSIANLRTMEKLRESLPEYPWAFKTRAIQGFF